MRSDALPGPDGNVKSDIDAIVAMYIRKTTRKRKSYSSYLLVEALTPKGPREKTMSTAFRRWSVGSR